MSGKKLLHVKCHLCKNTLWYNNKLINHFIYHDENDKYYCIDCYKIILDEKEWKENRQRIKNNQYSFCDDSSEEN